MKKSLFFMFFIVLIALVFSCDTPPGIKDIYGKVKWDNVPIEAARGRNLLQTSISRTVAENDFIQLYNNFYALIGEKVLSATPTQFKLGLERLWITKPGDCISMFSMPDEEPADRDEVHADFTSDYSYTPDAVLFPGDYNLFVAEFATFNDVYNGKYEILYTPEIIVTLPGYTSTELPDIKEYNYSTTSPLGTPLYNRKYLGSNQFQYTFAFLQPIFKAETALTPQLYRPYMDPSDPLYTTYAPDNFDFALDASTLNIRPFQYFVLDSRVLEMQAAMPKYPGEGDYFYILDYIDHTPLGDVYSTSRSSLMKMPFEGFTIEDSLVEVTQTEDGHEYTETIKTYTFTFGIDLENIIEVYDNGTSADKTDDIVVIANAYWERLSLTMAVDD